MSGPKWNYIVSMTAGCNFHGKTRRNIKCIGQKKSEKTNVIVDESWKPKITLQKTHKPCKTPKPTNHSEN